MNPLTGGAHYLELGLRNPRISPLPISRSRQDVAAVVFSDASYADDVKFHEEDRQRRQADLQKKQEGYMKRREAKVLKEAGRWQAVEDDYKRSLQNLEVKRSKWQAGQKNNASEAYNVITLDYDATGQGDYLRKKDEEKKYREGLRMFNLDSRMNSGFNIITGSTRLSPLPMRKFNY